MALRVMVVAAAVSVLISTGLAAAGPATADNAKYPWQMPDVIGMVLDDANGAIRQASGDPEQVIDTSEKNGPNRRILVPSLWRVCWQIPDAGTRVAGPRWIGVGVTRLGTECG